MVPRKGKRAIISSKMTYLKIKAKSEKGPISSNKSKLDTIKVRGTSLKVIRPLRGTFLAIRPPILTHFTVCAWNDVSCDRIHDMTHWICSVDKDNVFSKLVCYYVQILRDIEMENGATCLITMIYRQRLRNIMTHFFMNLFVPIIHLYVQNIRSKNIVNNII